MALNDLKAVDHQGLQVSGQEFVLFSSKVIAINHDPADFLSIEIDPAIVIHTKPGYVLYQVFQPERFRFQIPLRIKVQGIPTGFGHGLAAPDDNARKVPYITSRQNGIKGQPVIRSKQKRSLHQTYQQHQ